VLAYCTLLLSSEPEKKTWPQMKLIIRSYKSLTSPSFFLPPPTHAKETSSQFLLASSSPWVQCNGFLVGCSIIRVGCTKLTSSWPVSFFTQKIWSLVFCRLLTAHIVAWVLRTWDWLYSCVWFSSSWGYQFICPLWVVWVCGCKDTIL